LNWQIRRSIGKTFAGAMQRILKGENAVTFALKRDDWCTKENFAELYDDIFTTMVRAGVTMELPKHVFQDKEGNTFLYDDPKRLGRKTKYKLTHPERVLFVDEVGENTSQKQDGHIGGRKLVVFAKGT
jgi:hypothetical protein